MELAATGFAPSYRRATVKQASVAAVGLVSSIAAWPTGASFLWIVAYFTYSDSLRIFFRARFRAKACFTRRFAPGFR
jgi:hypothetical protein